MAGSNIANILGVHVDNVTMKTALESIFNFYNNGQNVSVYTPNAEMVMEAKKDPEFMEILNRSTLVVPDGAGVVVGAKILGEKLTEKVAGVDLVTAILSSEKPLSLYIYGGKPGVAEKAAKNITDMYKNITVCGTSHGYHKPEESSQLLEQIILTNPDFLMVGLGVPKQEMWIDENINKLNSTICIGCGGAIDVFSGNVRRAPDIFIKLNLEWFYRLIKQPSRLKRMLRIPVFLMLCLKKRIFS